MLTATVKRDIERIALDSAIEWPRLYGKTVLVTGASGFIGSLLIRAVLLHAEKANQNINVIAMVRDVKKAGSMFAHEVESGMLQFLEGDVTEPVKYSGKADYIIHCASNASPDKYLADPVGTMKINFYGTMNLLEYARSVNATKFLYVSTIEIYGKTQGIDVISEDDYGYISSLNVRSCYPESKKCCENLVCSYGDQYKLPVVIGRLPYIYGAGMSENDTKVCAMFARSVASGNDIVLKSEGKQLRSYTYVSDAISGLLVVMLNGENLQAYNIASKESVITIADMARRSCELFPQKNVSVKFDLPDEQDKKRFSFIENAVLCGERLEMLGWQARVSLDEGLKMAVEDQIERK